MLICLPAASFGAFRGINYSQAKKLTATADSFTRVEKFDQAIERYILASAKWSSAGFKNEIANSLELVQKLKDEKENYDRGIKYFGEDKLEFAKEAFENISESSKYYQEVQAKIHDIEEKLDKEIIAKEEKAKIQLKTTKTLTPTITPNPLPTIKSKSNLILIPILPQNTTSGNSDYEVPKDSKGIPCYNNTSHCEYECNDPDTMIDAWLHNLWFYETGLVANSSYQQKIDETKATIIQSCGRIP